MVRPKSFDYILKSLKERKKFERESAEKYKEKKCKHCGNHIFEMGQSSVEDVCSICSNLALM